MKIKQEILEAIIEEELEKVLIEKNLIKHLGKTVAPFALGGALATSVADKEPQKTPEAPVQASSEQEQEQEQEKPLAPPTRYNVLNVLGTTLSRLDPLFDPSTTRGRTAMAIALSIAGTETYGSLKNTKDFFTIMGGGRKVGNRMMGFAQFDTRYHKSNINTPQKYTSFLAKILTGKLRMPNGKSSVDAVSGLEKAILSGKVKEEKDLIRWLRLNRFGGSNWQGIDDGWRRVPGLGNSLIQFVLQNK